MSAGPSTISEFLAYAIDEDSLGSLRHWAERQGYAGASVQQGGPDMFAQVLESAAPPKLAVVDIDGQTDPLAAAARLVALCGPQCRLVITGSTNDVGLYRRMLATGAVDYLVKPLTSDILNQALQAAQRGGGKNAAEAAKEAKTIVFVGARGGVGTSTIAVNCGWLLAHEHNQTAALLDLDLQFGTSSLALDLQPGRGLRDIVSSPHRVDNLMIASSLISESDKFGVLGGEEPVDEPVHIEGAAITALLAEMKQNFDYILVDLPRHLFASQKRLLSSSHTIIIVSELSLAGIRDTLRLKAALGQLGYMGQVRCVASRLSSAHAGQINTAAFEKGAQIKIDLTVPEDAKAVAEAANGGKALGDVAKGAAITKALLSLCALIAPRKPDDGKKDSGLLGKLRGLAAKSKDGGAS